MTINLQETIKDEKGKVYTSKHILDAENNSFEIKEVTLGMAIRDTVCLQGSIERDYSEESALKRLEIYEKVADSDTVELSSEDISFIKELMIKRYSPIISAQYIRILNK